MEICTLSFNERIRYARSLTEITFGLLIVFCTASTSAGQSNNTHPLDPAIQLARQSLQQSQRNVQDYTATLVKRTRVDGELPEHQFMAVKIRNRKTIDGQLTTPMGVYIKFLKPKDVEGREVIWVEGQNREQLIAHESGFKNIMRVNLDPTGYLAMRGQKYPLTDIGIENLLLKIIDTAQNERNYDGTTVQAFRGARVGERACTMIQVTHPVKQPHFSFYRAQVFFDDEYNLPIRYVSWTWPETEGGEPVLEEEYTYMHLKLNVSLTDRDFDPDNPDYNYP
jgi:outer membrane lipoprotein-sorting protein